MAISLEKFVENSIPFLLVGIVLVLVFEFAVDVTQFQVYVDAFDFVVILFFALDLYYKRTRCHSWTYFVKNYWLEIFATIPFFWLFRVPAQPSEALRVVGEAGEVGRVLHPISEVESGGKLIKIPRELQALKLESSVKVIRLAKVKAVRRKKKR